MGMEEALRKAAPAVARAGAGSGRVWKDECAFTFQSPESADDGLYVNLVTRQAFSLEMVELDHERTDGKVYLCVKWTREEEDPDNAKRAKLEESEPTKLAIGVDGGFSAPDQIGGKGKLVKEYGLAVWPDMDYVVPYPLPPGTLKEPLPAAIVEAADAVIAADDASEQLEVKAWDAAEEPRPVSKFANDLEQVANGVRISPDPKTWFCAESGMTENLWLNLSTGYIGSGRRNWDGSGGTGAALRHFEETGRKYPLCVKLGTITPEGTADVYSYDPSEDCMVEDPKLAEHLAHFGIEIGKLKKTEKTMLEMDIALNKSLTLSAVLEGNEKLEACYGPECVGLYNLGNSCYCNSVLQVLFSLDPFQQRFLWGKRRNAERRKAYLTAPSEPQTDIETQLYKFAAALSDPDGVGLKAAESAEDDEDGAAVLAVPPKMLKDALGAGHPDFSGREQQDALEYMRYVLDKLGRIDHSATSSNALPGQWLAFNTEERVECCQSGQVKYKKALTNALSLNVPLDRKVNDDFLKARTEAATKGGQDQVELPVVSFDACLAATLGTSEQVDNFYSSAAKKRGKAVVSTKIASFPRYLVVQLKRYIVGDDWVPQKLECRVPVPRSFDLGKFRGTGLQAGETELPEDDEPAAVGGGAGASVSIEPDAELLVQLVSMGFNENGCKKALIAVQNAGAEQAMQWVLEHMEDPDFAEPPAQGAGASGAGGAGASAADPEAVSMLCSMGFEQDAAQLALKECNGNLERAADWLFSHAAELPSLLEAASQGGDSGGSGSGRASRADEIMAENDAESGEYFLRGFISHIGRTTTGGHYLCHVNKSQDLADVEKDHWVIFNDRKVAHSKNPPFEHGFVYVFERADLHR